MHIKFNFFGILCCFVGFFKAVTLYKLVGLENFWVSSTRSVVKPDVSLLHYFRGSYCLLAYLVKMFLMTSILHLIYLPSMHNLRATHLNNAPVHINLERRQFWGDSPEEPSRLSRGPDCNFPSSCCAWSELCENVKYFPKICTGGFYQFEFPMR